MSDSIGYALIVNVKYFENKDYYTNREDTIDDQINTVRAFKELGFETKLVTEDEDVNITASRFDSALQEGEASATMYTSMNFFINVKLFSSLCETVSSPFY